MMRMTHKIRIRSDLTAINFLLILQFITNIESFLRICPRPSRILRLVSRVLVGGNTIRNKGLKEEGIFNSKNADKFKSVNTHCQTDYKIGLSKIFAIFQVKVHTHGTY